MNINALKDDNIYTLHALTDVLGCNRKTAENYVIKKDFPITTVTINNRDYTAYVLTKEDIAKIDFEIQNNKKGQQYANAKPKTTESKAFSVSYSDSIKTQKNDTKISPEVVNAGYTPEMLRNVKQDSKDIIALANEKNDLKIKNLELEKELSEVKMQNTQLEATKLVLEQKMLMIEDKKGYLEGECAKLTQEKDALNSKMSQELNTLNKALQLKNAIILGLSAILIIIATIFITLNVVVK